jgi:polar amino acid transport system permease protein
LVNNSIFDPLLVFLTVATIYFALCYPLSRWSRRLEASLGVHSRGHSELA